MGCSDRPNSTSISAVHLQINGRRSLGRSDFEQCGCAVCVDLEPSISRSTVHSHALFSRARFQTRRARFNVSRWIQDQRPTFGDHAQARARVSPLDLRRPMQDRRLTSVRVVINFEDSREVYLQTEKGIEIQKYITISFQIKMS